jgi:hypothetical protein
MSFKFDGSGLKKFCKELDKLPELYRKAMADTLNDQAFKFKEEAANAIIGEFTSRRPDFVKRAMRVKKATPGAMEAIAGSAGFENNPAFSGFTEFLGAPDKRQRAPTMAARGGNKAAILPKANRMLAGVDFPNLDDGDVYGLPIAARLSMFHKQGAAKRFIMGGPEFPAGLYEFEKGKKTERGQPKVRMIQNFQTPASPRLFDWVQKALAAITPDWISERMTKNLDFEFKKYMAKKFK